MNDTSSMLMKELDDTSSMLMKELDDTSSMLMKELGLPPDAMISDQATRREPCPHHSGA
jgi:hypothetical protein